MGVIQSSINSAMQSAGYLKKIRNIKNDNQYISNPNILKWKQAVASMKERMSKFKAQHSLTDKADKADNSDNSEKQKWAEIRAKLAEIRAKQSLTDKADSMAKQKSDFKDLQLSIGGQKLDYNSLGENVRKQIDKEMNNDK